jgi:uncharacterized protein (DUF1778 family)
MDTASPNEFVGLNLPLSPSERNLLEQAVSLSRQSIDQFALTALLDRAREVVQSQTTRVLSHRDAVRFLELLDADVEPNDALRRAAGRYRGGHE